MLEVQINQVATSPTSLRFGCVVRYGKDGPVRFSTIVVDLEDFDAADLRDILAWCGRALERVLDQERKARDQGEDPLF